MPKFRPFLFPVLTTFVATLLSVSAAMAIQAAPVAVASAPAGSAASAVAWCSVAGLFVHFLMSLVAPGTPTPWNLPASTRFYLATGLSAVSGILSLLQSGSTLQSALLTTLGTLVAALLAHSPQMGAKVPATALKAVPPVAMLCLVFGLGFGSSGCALFQPNPTNDPGIYAMDAEQVANVVNDGAQALFVVLKPLLSPAEQPVAQATFDKAEAAYGDSIAALNAAISAWHDSKSADWAKLIADVETAVRDVVAAVDVFANPTSGAALGGVGPHLDANYAAQRAVLFKDLQVLARYKGR